MTLSTILATRPARSIDEAVAMMTAIDEALPGSDGVKWFNRLYLRVTVAVNAAAGAGDTFEDPAFLRTLDVVFANQYFDATATGDVNPQLAPPAWRPLFQARRDPGVARLQFALAGMNAHINRDLPAGIVECHTRLGGAPSETGVRRADFERVNGLLERVEGEVKTEFTTGAIGAIDAAAGNLDDLAAMWKVRKARAAAWSNAELLWYLGPFPRLKQNFFGQLDSFTGFAGRGLLKRVAVSLDS